MAMVLASGASALSNAYIVAPAEQIQAQCVLLAKDTAERIGLGELTNDSSVDMSVLLRCAASVSDLWAAAPAGNGSGDVHVYAFTLDGSSPKVSLSGTMDIECDDLHSSPRLRRLLDLALHVRLKLKCDTSSSMYSLIENNAIGFVLSDSHLCAVSLLEALDCSALLCLGISQVSVPVEGEALNEARAQANNFLYPSESGLAKTSANDGSHLQVPTSQAPSAIAEASVKEPSVLMRRRSRSKDSNSLLESVLANTEVRSAEVVKSKPAVPTPLNMRNLPLTPLSVKVPKRLQKMVAHRFYYRLRPLDRTDDDDKVTRAREAGNEPSTAAILETSDGEDADEWAEEEEEEEEEDDDDEEEEEEEKEEQEEERADSGENSGDIGGDTMDVDHSEESTAVSEIEAVDVHHLVTPELLVLLQQHVHDLFFCEEIAKWYMDKSVVKSALSRLPVFALPGLRRSSDSAAASRLWQTMASPDLLRPIVDSVPSLLHVSAQPIRTDPNAFQCSVLQDKFVVTGFDGDIRTLSSSAIRFWDQACLEPFKPTADVSFLVIPAPGTSRLEKENYTIPFFEALGSMYETCLLGRHRALAKCYQDLLNMPQHYRTQCLSASSTKEHDSVTVNDDPDSYYQHVLKQMESPSMKFKLSSVDTSIIVVYFIVPSSFAADIPAFARLVNRTRLLFGAPTWPSSSRRKNVLTQIVPRAAPALVIDGSHESLRATLKQLAFSVFSRCHFVPSIALPAASSRSRQPERGLGITAFEPAFVVHAGTPIPRVPAKPPRTASSSRDVGSPGGSSASSSSLLAVHVGYIVVSVGSRRWVCGASADMRGERVHTAVVRLDAGDAAISTALHCFWTESIRPILDFLHSRTDQGAMSVVLTRLGELLPHESDAWAAILRSRLGGVWRSYGHANVRHGGAASPVDVPVDVDAGDSMFEADSRFLVSAAFLMSCPGSPTLQLTPTFEALTSGASLMVSEDTCSVLLLHSQRPLRSRGDDAIVNANLYFSVMDDDNDDELQSSLQLSLIRYFSFHSEESEADTRPSPQLIQDAFTATVQQAAALNTMDVKNCFGRSAPCLPVHIGTAQRLAVLLSVATAGRA